MKQQQKWKLEARGFVVHSIRGSKYAQISCDQCAALVINGTATHEHGCPNAMHECRGCNELIPVRVKYCEDCAS